MFSQRAWVLLFVLLEFGPDVPNHHPYSLAGGDAGNVGDGGSGGGESDPNCPEPRLVCPHPDITFHLYTGRGPPVQLTEGRLAEAAAVFTDGAPLKVLIHDYGGNRDDFFNSAMREAYARRGPYNVVVVEWSALSRVPCYARAVRAAQLAGVCVGQLLSALARAPAPARRAPEALHLLGFGLGAHVAASAAGCLPRGGRIGRITGLDPAGRGFELSSADPSQRLDAGDAVFVDVVHTSAGALATAAALGHADFYVNGGDEQPACAREPPSPPPGLPLGARDHDPNATFASPQAAAMDQAHVDGIVQAMSAAAARDTCSHSLAPLYFAESLASTRGFWARPCSARWLRQHASAFPRSRHPPMPSPAPASSADDAAAASPPVLMGEDAPFSASGVLCVTTAVRAPYALGRDGNASITPTITTASSPSPSHAFPATGARLLVPAVPHAASPPPPSQHAAAAPSPGPAPPARSLLFDALGLLLAALFFYLAARYAAAAAAIEWRRGQRLRSARRKAQAQAHVASSSSAEVGAVDACLMDSIAGRAARWSLRRGHSRARAQPAPAPPPAPLSRSGSDEAAPATQQQQQQQSFVPTPVPFTASRRRH